MFGLPYVGMGDGSPLPELNTNVLRRYLAGVLAILSASQQETLCWYKHCPGSSRSTNSKPGDWVLIKTWKDQPLSPKWEEPFQIILTTEVIVWTRERLTEVKSVPFQELIKTA